MSKQENSIFMASAFAIELLLEATSQEVDEIVVEEGGNPVEFANTSRCLLRNAIKSSEQNKPQVDSELSLALGILLSLLRRRKGLNLKQLSKKAKVSLEDISLIESDPDHIPRPRTLVVLEKFFNLPSRSLARIAGAFGINDDLKGEAIRFAAKAQHIEKLSEEEKKLLNSFIKFLGSHE